MPSFQHGAEGRHRMGIARSVHQGPGHRPGVDGDSLAGTERLVGPAERQPFTAGPDVPPAVQLMALVFAAGRGDGVDQRHGVLPPCRRLAGGPGRADARADFAQDLGTAAQRRERLARAATQASPAATAVFAARSSCCRVTSPGQTALGWADTNQRRHLLIAPSISGSAPRAGLGWGRERRTAPRRRGPDSGAPVQRHVGIRADRGRVRRYPQRGF